MYDNVGFKLGKKSLGGLGVCDIAIVIGDVGVWISIVGRAEVVDGDAS